MQVKIYVIVTRRNQFIGAYSSQEKAEKARTRMIELEGLDSGLQVIEEPVDGAPEVVVHGTDVL